MKLAVTILCENPLRKTGLTTLFHEFVKHGLRLYPEMRWLIFAGPNQEWTIDAPQIEVVRDYPANDQLNRRLVADHFKMPVAARDRGADVLLTTGFVPARKTLPTAMQVFSLQHLDRRNRVGFARELYRKWLTRFSWPRADLIITNSDFAAAQITSLDPRYQRRLVRSYEGLQHDQFTPDIPPGEVAAFTNELGLAPGYLLWISNFYPYKQAELLLDAYALLPAEMRRCHPLVMVGGSWENLLEKSQEQARALGVADTVIFPGWVDDRWLAPLYRHARLFCLASREETFGRCVIEAMACGTPCLVNDIPIMREVTAGAAALEDFCDPRQVAARLATLLADDVEHSRLRRAGLKRSQDFTFEKLAAERLTAIARLVKEPTVQAAQTLQLT